MSMLAAKIGLLLVVVLSILRTTQTESVMDILVVFVASGVIPGTNVVVPPELMLLTVAAALMVITALLFRGYNKHQRTMRALLPEYPNYQEDPSYRQLIPGLRGVLAVNRAVRIRASEASVQLYNWLKYVGRPVALQAVTVPPNARDIVIRLDRWAPRRIDLRHNLARILVVLRRWADKALAYVVRMTTQ